MNSRTIDRFFCTAPIHPLHISQGNFAYIHQLLIGIPIFFSHSFEGEVLPSGFEPMNSRTIDRFVNLCANSPDKRSGILTVFSHSFEGEVQPSGFEPMNSRTIDRFFCTAPIHPLHISQGNFAYIHQLLIGIPIFFSHSFEGEVLPSGFEPMNSRTIDRFVNLCANSPASYISGKFCVFLYIF